MTVALNLNAGATEAGGATAARGHCDATVASGATGGGFQSRCPANLLLVQVNHLPLILEVHPVARDCGPDAVPRASGQMGQAGRSGALHVVEVNLVLRHACRLGLRVEPGFVHARGAVLRVEDHGGARAQQAISNVVRMIIGAEPPASWSCSGVHGSTAARNDTYICVQLYPGVHSRS